MQRPSALKILTAGLVFLGITFCESAHAELTVKPVSYSHNETTLEGVVAFDSSKSGKRPGVVVVHQWKGIGPHEEEVIRRLAELGYVAFAADIYGKGIRPKSTEEARAQATKYRNDRALLVQRVDAAVRALKRQPEVDPERIAALGYCFGGGAVLEYARQNGGVRGVVSFHGNLDTSTPIKQGTATKILVHHGQADPHVPPEQVAAFRSEMERAGVSWKLWEYPGAVHSFTDRQAGSDPSGGSAYDEAADRTSWERTEQFLREVFAL